MHVCMYMSLKRSEACVMLIVWLQGDVERLQLLQCDWPR